LNEGGEIMKCLVTRLYSKGRYLNTSEKVQVIQGDISFTNNTEILLMDGDKCLDQLFEPKIESIGTEGMRIVGIERIHKSGEQYEYKQAWYIRPIGRD